MRLCGKCGAPMSTSANGRWRCRPCGRSYQRDYARANIDRVRQVKREAMARRRESPEFRQRANAARRTPEARQRERERRRQLRDRRFFAWRARNWSQRHRTPVTAIALAGLWMRQRGRCALTGERLSRDAVLDHDVPKSRGGSHSIENLQWVTAQANSAKGEMTTAEFLAMCSQIAEWVGRRLVAVAGGAA